MLGVLEAALRDRRPAALVSVVQGEHAGATLVVTPRAGAAGPAGPSSGPSSGATPAAQGGLGDAGLDRAAGRDARADLAAGVSGLRRYGPAGEPGTAVTVFVDSFPAPPRMIIFGAVALAAALADAAKLLGYRVTVCDAREALATRRRFPMADEVALDWPQRHLACLAAPLGPADAVCVLTHDEKFDVPAIVGALGTGVGYLGVLGSRRTHARRLEALRRAGVDGAGAARLHAPIGLDLGSRTPEETAVAICAEIIGVRAGRAVPSLRDGRGPIH